jgi:predicted membrane GTPase involved in stress response
VIGENSKSGDLEVNPVRSKEKTNIRSVAKDEKVTLPPPKRLSVEEYIGYMVSLDELNINSPITTNQCLITILHVLLFNKRPRCLYRTRFFSCSIGIG